MGNAIPSRDIPRTMASWHADRMPVESMLSLVNPLREVNALFDELASGNATL